MTLPEMLDDLPQACDVGTKLNAKGYKESWIVASLEPASMRRATIMATTQIAHAAGGTSDEGMQVKLLEAAEDGSDVAVGGLRRQQKAASGLTRDSPLRALRARSMMWSGSWELGAGRCCRGSRA